MGQDIKLTPHVILFRLHINDNMLDQVETAPYLCCTLEYYLQWDVHINALAAKLSQKLGILKYLKKYMLPSLT